MCQSTAELPKAAEHTLLTVFISPASQHGQRCKD